MPAKKKAKKKAKAKTKRKEKAPRRRRTAAARNCGCEVKNFYRIASELLPVFDNKLYRFVIEVTSNVSCDPETPDHCMYVYWFWVNVEERDLDQNDQPSGPWRESQKQAVIRSAEILDSVVNAKVEHAPPRGSLIRYVAWEPLAPQTLPTPVIVQVAPDAHSPETVTLRKTPELCVPRVPNPNCPEWI